MSAVSLENRLPSVAIPVDRAMVVGPGTLLVTIMILVLGQATSSEGWLPWAAGWVSSWPWASSPLRPLS